MLTPGLLLLLQGAWPHKPKSRTFLRLANNCNGSLPAWTLEKVPDEKLICNKYSGLNAITKIQTIQNTSGRGKKKNQQTKLMIIKMVYHKLKGQMLWKTKQSYVVILSLLHVLFIYCIQTFGCWATDQQIALILLLYSLANCSGSFACSMDTSPIPGRMLYIASENFPIV